MSPYINIHILANSLVRNRETQSQTFLAAEERQKNVRNAFEVINSELLKNTTVLLLDDLITTGSTANECAKVLKENKVKKIYVLAIARPL
jgi:predicted amidophosphoribosyltransferase